jgi:hypothetical protein
MASPWMISNRHSFTGIDQYGYRWVTKMHEDTDDGTKLEM